MGKRRRKKKPTAVKNRLSIGVNIMRLLQDYAIVRGTSVGEELRRLINLAFTAPKEPPLREDFYWDENGGPARGSQGVIAILAEPEWWARLDDRAKRYGESRSESARAFIMGGAVMSPPPTLDEVRAVLEKAIAVLTKAGDEEVSFRDLARHLWPDKAAKWGGFNGTYAARIVCRRLSEQGLIEYVDSR